MKFDGVNWTIYTAGDGMVAASIANIYALMADSKGNIWIGTFNGGISKLTQVELDSIEISGPIDAAETSAIQYICTAYYSDGSTTDITENVIWDLPSDFAIINNWAC